MLSVGGILREHLGVRDGLPGFELVVTDWQHLARASAASPSQRDTPAPGCRDTHSWVINLRRPAAAAIYRVRSHVLAFTHSYFCEKDFTAVTSPRLVGGMSSGPVKVFDVDFFGKAAHLSLASVLFHGILVSGDMERVFEVGPLFNAENSHTATSVSEFTALEVSAAYLDRSAMMRLVEDYVGRLFDALSSSCEQELTLLGVDLNRCPRRFLTVTYSDAVDLITSQGIQYEWGHSSQLSGSAASILRREIGGFFWIVDQPDQHKWFFAGSRAEGARVVCLDCQLWHERVANLAEGSERVTDETILRKRLADRGLAAEEFEPYLTAMRQGCPPFAGIGIGLDRLLMVALNLPNVRDVILFPRDPSRLTP